MHARNTTRGMRAVSESGWSSEAPLGFAGGDVNVRRYDGNNATNLTDPSGLAAPPRTTLAAEIPSDKPSRDYLYVDEIIASSALLYSEDKKAEKELEATPWQITGKSEKQFVENMRALKKNAKVTIQAHYLHPREGITDLSQFVTYVQRQGKAAKGIYLFMGHGDGMYATKAVASLMLAGGTNPLLQSSLFAQLGSSTALMNPAKSTSKRDERVWIDPKSIESVSKGFNDLPSDVRIGFLGCGAGIYNNAINKQNRIVNKYEHAECATFKPDMLCYVANEWYYDLLGEINKLHKQTNEPVTIHLLIAPYMPITQFSPSDKARQAELKKNRLDKGKYLFQNW